ncbi:MAG TPA: TetR/AcrR family transcriptional regulator, partial [Chloroflexia bacterium]|nr:TetR/AcrR family transcriptional regulator [Chloroflexia bacterium]
HSLLNEGSEDIHPSRGARRRARTRADLLVAARQVFATRGYHETSIAEITAAADVGVGTFYLHFRDKDEVLSALLQEGLTGLRQQIARSLVTARPAQQIPTVIQAIFNFAYSNRDLFSIVLTGGSPLGVGFRARAELADLLAGVLEAAEARGMLLGYDIPLLARMLSGVIAQGILWWMEYDTPDPAGMTAQMLRLLREGLPPALLADPPTSPECGKETL